MCCLCPQQIVQKVLEMNCGEKAIRRHLKTNHQTKKSGSAVRKIKEESAESFSCGLT